MKTFDLVRDEDASGVSGVGCVAEGVEFTDGTVALRWLTKMACTGLYDSVDHVIAIHGHGDKTKVVYK
jgi:hypothetical protein